MIGRWARHIRLPQWAHFLVLPLAGIDSRSAPEVYLPAAALGVAITFSILTFGFLLNSITDRHMDLGVTKNQLRDTALGPYRVAVAAFGAAAVALSLIGPWPVFVATLIAIVSGWAYSAGPRLKAVPVVGSAMNVAYFAPMLFVGLATPLMPPALGLLIGVFSPLLLQNQLLHEAADAEEDRGGGVATTFVRLGPRVSGAFATACGLAATGVVATSGPPEYRLLLAVAFAALFSGAYPWALFRFGHGAAHMARIRIAHRWTAVAAGTALYAMVLRGGS